MIIRRISEVPLELTHEYYVVALRSPRCGAEALA
jgi:hypothetical protein